MAGLKNEPPKSVADYAVTEVKDYSKSVAINLITGEETEIKLPKSDVIELRLSNGCSLIVRPSGTEPKIKIYISAIGKTKQESEAICEKLKLAGDSLMK